MHGYSFFVKVMMTLYSKTFIYCGGQEEPKPNCTTAGHASAGMCQPASICNLAEDQMSLIFELGLKMELKCKTGAKANAGTSTGAGVGAEPGAQTEAAAGAGAKTSLEAGVGVGAEYGAGG